MPWLMVTLFVPNVNDLISLESRPVDQDTAFDRVLGSLQRVLKPASAVRSTPIRGEMLKGCARKLRASHERFMRDLAEHPEKGTIRKGVTFIGSDGRHHVTISTHTLGRATHGVAFQDGLTIGC